NSFWAAALHETGKVTLPSLATPAESCASVGSVTPTARISSHPRNRAITVRRVLMMDAPMAVSVEDEPYTATMLLLPRVVGRVHEGEVGRAHAVHLDDGLL